MNESKVCIISRNYLYDIEEGFYTFFQQAPKTTLKINLKVNVPLQINTAFPSQKTVFCQTYFHFMTLSCSISFNKP